MTFKKNGLLRRIAYHWNRDWRGDKKPEKTSVCALFWLTVWAIAIAWPWIWGSRVFGWAIRIVGFLPALVLFGALPTGPSWRFEPGPENQGTGPFPFRRIKRWPKVRGWRIEPGSILIAALVVALFSAIIWDLVIQKFFVQTVFGTAEGRWIFGIITTLVALLILRAKTKNTEGWQMTAAFVKSQKERFCPIVEFK